MLSKRSHRYPRLVLNTANAYTTDTIYRGRMHLAYQRRERDLVATFHNSLTLLSAEIEGRSFGGGVLELVPSEINRLLVPLPDAFGEELGRLDQLVRTCCQPESSEALITETDLLLVKADCGFTTELVDELHGAREVLLRRRLDRTGVGRRELEHLTEQVSLPESRRGHLGAQRSARPACKAGASN